MVLRAAEGLDTLTVRGARGVDVLGDGGGSDEADRLDRAVLEQFVDGELVALEDVEDAVGQARFLPQFREPDAGGGVLLAGLEDDGVAAGDGDGEEPHRHHGGEVERGDDADGAEGLADGEDVDLGGGVLGEAALEQVGDAAGEFDDFLAAGDLAEGVGEDLAVFGGDDGGEFLLAGVEKLAEGEEDRGALGQRGVAPGGERRCGGGDDGAGVVEVGQGQLPGDLTGGGVGDVGGAVGRAGERLAVHPVPDGIRGHDNSYFPYFATWSVIVCS